MKNEKPNKLIIKLKSFARRHVVLSTVVLLLFASTFFVRGQSVQIQYTDEEVFDYVRIDYSIYGYCIGVKPQNQNAAGSAKRFTRELLFCDMDTSVKKVVNEWVLQYGNEETFKLKLKSFLFNTNKRRDKLIDDIRAMGYKVDAIAL